MIAFMVEMPVPVVVFDGEYCMDKERCEGSDIVLHKKKNQRTGE